MRTSHEQRGFLSYGRKTKDKEIRATVSFDKGGFKIVGHSVNEQSYEGYGMERISERKGTDLLLEFSLSTDELIAFSKAAIDAAIEKIRDESKRSEDNWNKARSELHEKDDQIKALKKLIGESVQ